MCVCMRVCVRLFRGGWVWVRMCVVECMCVFVCTMVIYSPPIIIIFPSYLIGILDTI